MRGGGASNERGVAWSEVAWMRQMQQPSLRIEVHATQSNNIYG